MNIRDHLDAFLELNGWIMAISGVSIFGAISYIIKLIRKNLSENEKKNKMLQEIYDNQAKLTKDLEEIREQGALRQEANIASLRDRIYAMYAFIIKRPEHYITTDELDNLEQIWRAYHNLGGNSKGEKMYNYISKFDIRDDD